MESTLIDIIDKSYELCDQIQFRDHERAAYEALCAEVFPGLSFEKWYQAGYWDGKLFNPHVLMDGDRIVSAVSVNKMHVQIGNQPPRLYIQLGGVMTAPDCRKQGLSGALMDRILTEWEDKCDGIYLFANDSVLDFYPKFGFKAVEEHQYRMSVRSDDCAEKAVRLNMNDKADVDRLLKYFELGNPFSNINIANKGLLMFYCMKYNKNDVYYVEAEDAVVIAGHEGEAMVVYDVFCNKGCSLENILAAVSDDNTETAYFGFPINRTKHCKLGLYEEEDNTLFILDKNESDSLAEFLKVPELAGKLMMPLLSHS